MTAKFAQKTRFSHGHYTTDIDLQLVVIVPIICADKLVLRVDLKSVQMGLSLDPDLFYIPATQAMILNDQGQI